MKLFTSFLRGCVRDCPFRFRCFIMAMSVLLAAMAIASLHTGCATSPSGLSRQQDIYRVSTNALGQVKQSILPFVIPSALATQN